MGSRAQSCFDRLTADERASLRKLCQSAVDRRIPDDHAEVLMSLGLVELSCGDIGPTSAGRVAIARETAQ